MKKIIFVLLIVVLFIPVLQQNFKLFEFRKLTGVTNESPKPEFTIAKWFEGEFQQQYEEYHGTIFGCRNFLIRLFNTIDYALFRLPHTSVVVGKNEYLFQGDYLSEIIGDGFVGKDSMESIVKQIKLVQNDLAIKNILLLTVLAPAKSYYFKEYIPDYYYKKLKNETSYGALLNSAINNNLYFIDLNGWFLKMKDTIQYPLFPKQGIHWSFQGMAFSADSIVKYIENKLKIDITDVNFKLEYPDTLKETDYDLGDLLNIQYNLPFNKMAYPEFSIDNNHKKRPRLLVIADSFYWSIFNKGLFYKVFSDEHFYYYFSSIYSVDLEIRDNPSDYNLLREVEKYDVILLLQSSPNYQRPGLGFIKSYVFNKDRYEQRKILAIKSIVKNKNLQLIVENYSAMNKTTIETAKNSIGDSIASADMNFIEKMKLKMRSNPEWVLSIAKRAYNIKIPYEQLMDDDALRMLEQYKSKD